MRQFTNGVSPSGPALLSLPSGMNRTNHFTLKRHFSNALAFCVRIMGRVVLFFALKGTKRDSAKR